MAGREVWPLRLLPQHVAPAEFDRVQVWKPPAARVMRPANMTFEHTLIAVDVWVAEGVPVRVWLREPVCDTEGVPVRVWLLVPVCALEGVPVCMELGVAVCVELGIPVDVPVCVELGVPVCV